MVRFYYHCLLFLAFSIGFLLHLVSSLTDVLPFTQVVDVSQPFPRMTLCFTSYVFYFGVVLK